MDITESKKYSFGDLPNDCACIIFSFLSLEEHWSRIAVLSRRFSKLLKKPDAWPPRLTLIKRHNLNVVLDRYKDFEFKELKASWLDAFDDGHIKLLSHMPLEKVILRYSTHITDVSPICKPSLISLDLSSTGFQFKTGDDRKRLLCAFQKTSLTTLCLDDCKIMDGDLSLLARISTLTSLSLMYAFVSSQGLKHLASLPLTSLNLNSSPIGDKGLEPLKKLPLKEFMLYKCGITDDGVQSCLSGMPLRTVDLSRNHITKTSLTYLPSTLNELLLVDNGLDDNSLDLLHRFHELTTLCISHNPITNSGLEKLTEIKTLSKLAMNRCSLLSDEGLKVIGLMKSLRIIYLNMCPFTLEGMHSLVKSGHALKKISLRNCPQLGEHHHQELQSYFPKTKIDLRKFATSL